MPIGANDRAAGALILICRLLVGRTRILLFAAFLGQCLGGELFSLLGRFCAVTLPAVVVIIRGLGHCFNRRLECDLDQALRAAM